MIKRLLRRLLVAVVFLAATVIVFFGTFSAPTGSMERTISSGDFVIVNKFRFGLNTQNLVPLFGSLLSFKPLLQWSGPERGEVVVFIHPGKRDVVTPTVSEYYLKRCVAIAGDTVTIRGGRLYVNSRFVPAAPHAQSSAETPEMRMMRNRDEQYLTFPAGYGYTSDDYGPLRVPGIGDTLWLEGKAFAAWSVFIEREGHDVDGNARTIDGTPANRYIVEQDYVFCLGDNRDNSLDSRFDGCVPVRNLYGSPLVIAWSWDISQPLPDRFSTIRWSRIGQCIE